MSESRKRLILSCAALLGMGLAAVLWMVQNRHPSGPAEQWVQSVGYASLARYNQVTALTPDFKHPHDLTNEQFATIQDVLQHDGRNPKVLAVVALMPIPSFTQHRRAVQILRPYMGERDLSQEIYMVLGTYWGDGDRTLLRELARDPQPAVSKMAQAVMSGSGVSH